jgi:hypothetical protein
MWQTFLEKLLPVLINAGIDSLHVTTAPTAAPGATTTPGQAPAPPTATGPIDEIKQLQIFLNEAMTPNPPLVVDGWLGPKTKALLLAGLAKLKPYLPMLGGR